MCVAFVYSRNGRCASLVFRRYMPYAVSYPGRPLQITWYSKEPFAQSPHLLIAKRGCLQTVELGAIVRCHQPCRSFPSYDLTPWKSGL